MRFIEAVNEAIDLLEDYREEVREQDSEGLIQPEDADPLIERIGDVIAGLQREN